MSAKTIAEIPEIVIPDDCRRDPFRSTWRFNLTTPHGSIEVEVGRCGSLFCRGTPEAIVAYGLARPEWMPGLYGNNLTQQAVVFESDGPRLIHGKPRGKRSTAPRIIIRAWGAIRRTIDVQVPISKRQQEQIEAMNGQIKQQQEQKCESTGVSDLSDPITIQRAVVIHANDLIDRVRKQTDVVEKFSLKYTAESEARILRVIGELRIAFAEANMVHLVPKYRAKGNVIHFPAIGERRTTQ